MMQLLCLLFIVCVFYHVEVSESTISTAVYYSTKISAASLASEATTTKTLNTASKIFCATAAIKEPWCHMICYRGQTCSLYDLQYPSGYDDHSSDAVDYCMTDRYRGCIKDDGSYVPPGQFVPGACEMLLCNGSTMISARLATADQIDALYTQVDGLGGVYLPAGIRANYTCGTSVCASVGGQLMVPDNFSVLQAYMNAVPNTSTYYSLGIRNQMWDNGRAITAAEWGSGQPSHGHQCGALVMEWGPRINDVDCSWYYSLICQKP